MYSSFHLIVFYNSIESRHCAFVETVFGIELFTFRKKFTISVTYSTILSNYNYTKTTGTMPRSGMTRLPHGYMKQNDDKTRNFTQKNNWGGANNIDKQHATSKYDVKVRVKLVCNQVIADLKV